MSLPITKAIVPAAGLGTRLMPATKSQPKEMLPIVDTPAIQYVVEEAVSSGISDILMIIGKGKRAIEEHFDRNFELESEIIIKAALARYQICFVPIETIYHPHGASKIRHTLDTWRFIKLFFRSLIWTSKDFTKEYLTNG